MVHTSGKDTVLLIEFLERTVNKMEDLHKDVAVLKTTVALLLTFVGAAVLTMIGYMVHTESARGEVRDRLTLHELTSHASKETQDKNSTLLRKLNKDANRRKKFSEHPSSRSSLNVGP